MSDTNSKPPIRVLLVEDEPDVRTVAESILSSFGFAVSSVGNGKEAIDFLSGSRPDIVLSDIRMPVIDGFQLLQRIRSDPLLCQIPFIIVSAKAESADQRMGMSLGADDYVTKPYRPEDLRNTIEVRVMRSKQVSDSISNHKRFVTQVLPHELRTPLMGVIGYADLMMDAAAEGKTLSVAELSEYGRMLQLSGARILKIVENLLFWAKLEAPQSPAEGSAKLMETQEDVTAEGLRSIAEQASKQFGRQYDVSVDCPRRARIQVITPGFEFVTKHLVENALKYSLPRTPVRISVTTDADELTLSVSDSGRGMTRDEFDRIRRSGHLEHDRNRQPGLGMGLMLATAFVRKSGGRLDLQPNDKGKGLTVLMHLPLAAESVPPS